MNFDLVVLRFKLLLRQKIGWLSLLAGLGLVLLGFATANISYVSPGKIFWDFTLGFSFVVVHLLGIYLACQLFHDEKDRRTLHLVLVSGVSRSSWIVSNVLGIWLGLLAIDLVWFATSWGISFLSFSWAGEAILLQTKILQAFSLLIVISFSALFSLFLKPLLALFLSFSMTFFLYSVSAVKRVFSDTQSGHLVDASWALQVLKVTKVLPPLEWFDLKVFVGYESSIAWSTVALTALLGLAWSTILLVLSGWRFSKLDL
jgi:ABC-type transport system involved in multi-copper enzyme maturation permease subunit